MSEIWREPLLHFLVLGAGLFIAYGALHGEDVESDPQVILVDREHLLTFMQYRARSFDAARFDAMLDALSPAERGRLTKDYVREEALVREAKALQLDRNDYVARRRLIQQLEFITRGFAEQNLLLSEQQVQQYYREHRTEYAVEPKVTFAHVFFSSEQHGVARAEALARAELSLLNRRRARFADAPAHGERFLYHVNYVQREPAEVASHFGGAMQAQLFALEPIDRTWRGPFESAYGFHLVLLVARQSGFVPPLAEIRERVERSARQALLDMRLENALDAIVQGYSVRVQPIGIG